MTWISTKRRKLRMPTTMRHRGLDTRRREHNHRENAFAETWEQENERRPGVNFGQGMLQDLLAKRSEKWPYYPCLRKVIDNRDAAIVATVVQWLGTNVGMSFLEEALKRCGFRIERDPRWEHKGGEFCSKCRGKDRWRHGERGEVICGWCGIGKPVATMRNSKGEPAMAVPAEVDGNGTDGEDDDFSNDMSLVEAGRKLIDAMEGRSLRKTFSSGIAVNQAFHEFKHVVEREEKIEVEPMPRVAWPPPTIRTAATECPFCKATLQVYVPNSAEEELQAAQHALEAYRFESQAAICRAVTEKEEAQAALERAKGTVRRLSTHLLDALIEDCIHDDWLLRALQPELEALCAAIERAKEAR